MKHRSTPTVVRIRRSTRSGRRPLEERAQPTPERLRRAGGDFERGDTGRITMRDNPLERIEMKVRVIE